MFLPAGYVKLEGGTVNRSNYPRLVALADTYNLWTDDTTANPGLFGEGDGSTTMVLPNWTGRMAQFTETGVGSGRDAGLPNIIGGNIASTGYNNTASMPFGTGAIQTEQYSPNKGVYQYDLNGFSVVDKFYFYASLSNPIYSASTTVQPPAINTFAIMRY